VALFNNWFNIEMIVVRDLTEGHAQERTDVDQQSLCGWLQIFVTPTTFDATLVENHREAAISYF
jgi:hypothetical protein